MRSILCRAMQPAARIKFFIIVDDHVCSYAIQHHSFETLTGVVI